jgi:hypothetical protein
MYEIHKRLHESLFFRKVFLKSLKPQYLTGGLSLQGFSENNINIGINNGK